jgi:crotonobetaine/carnitine-CoA ligase
MSMMPDRTEVVLRHFLETFAAKTPENDAILFEDDTIWSYQKLVKEAHRGANRLVGVGVRRSDHVLIFLPNDEHWIRAWLAAAFMGAVIVPVNTAYKGEMLRHICQDSKARFMVTTPDLAERLEGLDLALTVIDPADLATGSAADYELDRPIEPWDTHQILYSSGTTGPSKGSVGSYFYTYMASPGFLPYLGPEDTFLIDHPLYHMSGMMHTYITWSAGGRIVLRTRFSGSNYNEVLRKTGATMAIMVGSIPAFLENKPPQPDDCDNQLRVVQIGPVFRDCHAMIERFGIERLFSGFGMTETGALIQNHDVLQYPTSCGKAREGVNLRLVDENDIPVPVGTPGELIVRCDRPWEMTAGYWNLPEQTAAAWRNGWFHTGDLLTCDENGYYHFVDRDKDCIRRRGENISSFEVEREVMAFPPVQEAACVPCLCEHGEGEVKVFVTVNCEDGCVFDPAALIRFLIPRMPHFMVPRYVEVIDAFSKTAVGRVQKFKLKKMGNCDCTWDREMAGIKVGR